jgi:hypothetical protein
LLALLLMSAASACANGSGSFCSAARPHRFSDATVTAMTDEEVAQELAHNETGVKLCGWKP